MTSAMSIVPSWLLSPRTKLESCALAKPGASRAVGSANGRNPLAIVLPCHRVIGADGAMVGFGGGVPIKRWLLDHESGTQRLF